MEPVLVMLGDGNWKYQLKVHEDYVRTTILGHFACIFVIVMNLADVITSLIQVLDSNSANYKRPAQTNIFLLNNYNYVANCCKGQQFHEELGEKYITKYDRLIRGLKDNYMDK